MSDTRSEFLTAPMGWMGVMSILIMVAISLHTLIYAFVDAAQPAVVEGTLVGVFDSFE